ncbi:MAG: PAS domain-containing protein [Desulfobacterium sp.]|nr:PAS domain-containing protein [Desulfobacterium sp.]
MKKKITTMGLLILVVIGIVGIAYSQQNNLRRLELKKLRQTGISLIGLLSVSATAKGMTDNTDALVRTLAMLHSTHHLVYCIIDNLETGSSLIFAPRAMDADIPDHVTTKAAHTTGLTIQRFNTPANTHVTEFSNPVFKQGAPAARVRLGMIEPTISIFTLEALVLPGKIALIILFAMICEYYWFIRMVDSLQPMDGEPIPEKKRAGRENNLIKVIDNTRGLLDELFQQIKQSENNTRKLSSRVSIMEFENRQLLNIFDALDFGILILDSRETIFYVNTYFLALLGSERATMLDQPFDEAIDHGALKEFILQQNLMQQAGGGRQRETTFPDNRPDRVYRLGSNPLLDLEEALFGRLIIVTDITKEKKSEHAKQDFVTHIAHELRTPLTNIKAYNELLMDGEVTSPEMQKEFFNTINGETNRLATLISSILNLAEMEIGQVSIHGDLVKTEWLVESAMEAMTAVAKEKEISLKTELPDNFPLLTGDKEMLKSALINLLGNAVKYTPEQGEVVFSLEEDQETVIFKVTDTGYGIDDQDLPHIFDKFYRSENDQVVQEQGSGLGLAITSEIIRLHDGFIEVESTPGSGSSFTTTLPKKEYLIG